MNDKKPTNIFEALRELHVQRNSAAEYTSNISIPDNAFNTEDAYIEGYIKGWEDAYSDAIDRILLYLSENHK